MLSLRFVAFLGLVLVAGSLRAEPVPARGVRLSFVRTEVASGCIAAPVLEREIARRMGQNPFEGEARQWIEGTIDAQAGAFEVQLFERDANGHTLGTRRFREPASDCHKLDDAIELAIALIIDPSAQLAPALPENEQPPAQNLPSAPAQPAAILALPPNPTFVRAQLLSQTRGNGNGLLRAVTPNKEAENRLGAAFVAVDAVALHGVLPGVAFGGELITRFSLDARERVLLRSAAMVLPQKVANEQGKLGYSLAALEAGVCMQERSRHSLAFACGGLGIGSVHVTVYNPDPRNPDDRLWTALRLEGGVALRIAGPVWVEARLFDFVPFQRWAFKVVDRKDGLEKPLPAYEQSWFMPGAALGIGLHFD